MAVCNSSTTVNTADTAQTTNVVQDSTATENSGAAFTFKTDPNSTFSYTVSSLMDLVNFDAAYNAELINIPLLMMAGSEADTLDMTQEVFNAATDTEDKELFLIDGARHIETYWVHEYVEQEVNKLVEFYGPRL